MKVAVTEQGSEGVSPVGTRFGRAKWIVVVDTGTHESEVHDNHMNRRLAAADVSGVRT